MSRFKQKMSRFNRILQEEADRLTLQTQTLENFRDALATKRPNLEEIFKQKKLYKDPQVGVTITIFKTRRDEKYSKEIMEDIFWNKFPSIAKDFGDVVAVLGEKNQFTKEELDLCLLFGMEPVQLTTSRNGFGNN